MVVSPGRMGGAGTPDQGGGGGKVAGAGRRGPVGAMETGGKMSFGVCLGRRGVLLAAEDEAVVGPLAVCEAVEGRRMAHAKQK